MNTCSMLRVQEMFFAVLETLLEKATKMPVIHKPRGSLKAQTHKCTHAGEWGRRCIVKEGTGVRKGEEKRNRCSSGLQTPPTLFIISLVKVASYLKKPAWGCSGMTSLNHEISNSLCVQVCLSL